MQDYPFAKSTVRAFLWTSVLRTPFWAIFSMLPFILYKDLQASQWEITLLATLKPLVAILSMYWSFFIHRRRKRLRSNVVWAGILGYLPFFAVPFIDGPWMLIAAAAIYMLFNRGVIPAWMEVLKLNVPKIERERVFAFGTAFCYLGGGVFPFLIGWALDGYELVWRWLFPLTAFIAILGFIFQARIQVSEGAEEQQEPEVDATQLIRPWKAALDLLRRRPDFARFQLGFLFGGAGLMVLQPALPKFFVDVLGLSYTETSIAFTLCKGIGFALASPLWAGWMNRIDIYRFSALVTLMAAMFPLGLMMAQWHLAWLFVAYLGYGVMQAGSEMSWHLSGPVFAPHEDSSLYSGVNVVMVGGRGAIAPPFGNLFCSVAGPVAVLWLACALCLTGGASLLYGRRRAQAAPLEACGTPG